jgi:hypothetical protein
LTARTEDERGDQALARTAAPDSGPLSHEQRLKRWSEMLSALLLGLVTLATAWSGYQAARWGGVQSILFADALGTLVESARVSAAADQLAEVDVSLFVEYFNAYAAGDKELVAAYYELFRPEFRSAVDAWLAFERAADAADSPGAPTDPFQMPEYRVALEEKAIQLEEEADRVFERGKEANQHSDDYILNAVILASVLFLAGIAPRFDWPPISIIILSMAAILLAVGLYNLATLPIY